MLIVTENIQTGNEAHGLRRRRLTTYKVHESNESTKIWRAEPPNIYSKNWSETRDLSVGKYLLFYANKGEICPFFDTNQVRPWNQLWIQLTS